MSTMASPDRVTLYYREGSSDKVYQAAIEPTGTGFHVTFAFGRRSSTLQTGTKTNAPVDYASAKAIFDRLVLEKTRKGYTPGEDGKAYQGTRTNNAPPASCPNCSRPSPKTKHCHCWKIRRGGPRRSLTANGS